MMTDVCSGFISVGKRLKWCFCKINYRDSGYGTSLGNLAACPVVYVSANQQCGALVDYPDYIIGITMIATGEQYEFRRYMVREIVYDGITIGNQHSFITDRQ